VRRCNNFLPFHEAKKSIYENRKVFEGLPNEVLKFLVPPENRAVREITRLISSPASDFLILERGDIFSHHGMSIEGGERERERLS